MDRFREKKHQYKHIPEDIVKQIIEHLPLKSPVRFKSTSKLWFSLINGIIRRRAIFRLSQVKEKLDDMYSNFCALYGEIDEFLNRAYNAHVIICVGEQLKQKQDEMLKLLAVGGDDIDRYINGIDGLRGEITAYVHAIDSHRMRAIALVESSYVLQGY